MRFAISLTAMCVLAACSAPPSLRADKKAHSTEEDDATEGAVDPATTTSKTPAKGPTSSTPIKPLSQPDQTPIKGRTITSPRQVIAAGAFTAETPTVRAKDYHSFDITGADCMKCHGTGGDAPHLAFGGTIALGKDWKWKPVAAGGGGGDDDDDDYEDSDYDDGSDDDGYDDDGYDDEYDSDDDYDDDSDYDGPRRKGSPGDRTYPSRYTRVRLIGSDGMMFDTVTDEDGNFWFKAKEEVKVPAYTGITFGSAFVVTGSTNGIACASCHESKAADSPGRLWTWNGRTPRQ